MKYLLHIIIMSVLLISCTTTKYVDVPIETVRTEYINQLHKDSVFVHDSIDRYIRGDTVYQYKYRYIYKYLNNTDTIVKTDSIPIKVKTIEIKEVNKLKSYQSFLMNIGVLSIAVVCFLIGKKLRSVIMKA